MCIGGHVWGRELYLFIVGLLFNWGTSQTRKSSSSICSTFCGKEKEVNDLGRVIKRCSFHGSVFAIVGLPGLSPPPSPEAARPVLWGFLACPYPLSSPPSQHLLFLTACRHCLLCSAWSQVRKMGRVSMGFPCGKLVKSLSLVLPPKRNKEVYAFSKIVRLWEPF